MLVVWRGSVMRDIGPQPLATTANHAAIVAFVAYTFFALEALDAMST